MNSQFDFQIETVQIKNGTGFVVRDDLLEGGTKQRAIVPYLANLEHEGFKEFVYASPFAGFAQVALASALKYLDVQATVFCEPNNETKKHRFSQLAEKMGAKVILCKDLADAESQAKDYAQESPLRFKLPLGFDDDRYRNELSKSVGSLWNKVGNQIAPKNLWLPVGSGTLAQVFRKVVDTEVTLQCVDVHVLKPEDERISRLRRLKNVIYRGAVLKFHEECDTSCPVPSNAHYDSKVYEVFAREADDGDVWWNVAR